VYNCGRKLRGARVKGKIFLCLRKDWEILRKVTKLFV